MYCLVRAIWRNSLVTADVAASSTFDSRLISVESTSISSSERLLKIFADTSAPRLASRIAAFLVPLTDSISAAIASRSRRRQRALLRHPGADELRRHFGLGLGQPQRLLADVLALADLLRHSGQRRVDGHPFARRGESLGRHGGACLIGGHRPRQARPALAPAHE